MGKVKRVKKTDVQESVNDNVVSDKKPRKSKTDSIHYLTNVFEHYDHLVVLVSNIENDKSNHIELLKVMKMFKEVSDEFIELLKPMSSKVFKSVFINRVEFLKTRLNIIINDAIESK